MATTDLLRRLPAVDEVLRRADVAPFAARVSSSLLASWVREDLAEIRARVLDGSIAGGDLDTRVEAIAARLAEKTAALEHPPLRRVINATGVIVHTNLGRAPLAAEALEAALAAGSSYVDLEYDLARGERGSRGAHLALAAEALFPGRGLLAVNNNAAAVLLVLNTLAEGREVVVSRGELVEIGGSFRIPDVMRKAGAILREVGTTNRTRIADYRAAVSERTGLLVKVHTSNYRILGFVEETPLAELVALGREAAVPVVMDEGSGNLATAESGPLEGEPSVTAVLAAGASLVCFSGDKLLGGPQAGLVVGDRDLVALCAKNPLARALRLDKLTLAALAATLGVHASRRAAEAIPVQRALARDAATIGARAGLLAERLRGRAAPLEAEVTAGESRIGGGAAPLRDLPTRLLALRPSRKTVEAFETALRGGEPPVVGRVEHGTFLVDLRTVEPGDDDALAGALDRAAR